MKLLSIAVPCYNSAAYMDRCIESLLAGGEDVEILIVDDGSVKDDTAQKADEWAARHPSIIRAIHQENKGHGGAVNTGIENATGLFFKVVDSDDRLNTKAFHHVLAALRAHEHDADPLDMLLTNFVYDKQGARHKKVMRLAGKLPEGQVFSWDRFPVMHTWEYILMHSIVYRTQVLRNSGLRLPEHTFYVDNIYAFQPFPFVKNILYLNEDLYRYYIGRNDQSVNEDVMISRMDQQMRVNRLMFEEYARAQFPHPRCASYMMNYLRIITMVSTVLCIRSGTEEHLAQKEELWRWMEQTDEPTWRRIRFSPVGHLLSLPGAAGRKVIGWGYTVAQKLFGFN